MSGERRARLLDGDASVRPLRPKSFDMPCLLLRNAGELVSKEDLLFGVCGHTKRSRYTRLVASVAALEL